MILQALLERYEDLAARGEISKPGWSPVNVSFGLVLSDNGELEQVVPLLEEVMRGKKSVQAPRVMQVPEQIVRAGIKPKSNFLCDNSSFILGIDGKGKPEQAASYFEVCAALHNEILADVDSPAAHTILRFFETWNPGSAENHPALIECLEDIKSGANIIFRVRGQFAHEDAMIAAAWQCQYEIDEGDEKGVCLVTGKDSSTTARIHPKIKGVRGAQTMGASLVAFDKGSPAYSSFGKLEGDNAPVGKYAAFAYGTALNALLADREHIQQFGDTTLVFWAKSGQVACQNIFSQMLGTTSNEMTDSSLKSAMMRLASGKPTQWEDTEISPDTPFYILGLAPNAARLSVRFFLRDSFGAFAAKLWAHQERLEIARPAFDKRESLSVWELLRETVNPNSREKKASPLMSGELIRAILSGGRYPATLLNNVMLRIRAEREITRGRAAIIKAYYSRNEHIDCPREVLTVQLNDSKNTAYRLGRAFSLLESIQETANPGIKATIRDKYFNSASATPATVFPRLINLAQHHLRKIDGGLKVHLERELSEVLVDIADFPARLSLPGQGAFQLGYYHQRQKRFESKKREDN